MPVKLWCPECDKEIEVSAEQPKCPTCQLNLHAIYERDRHEQALEKLKAKRKETKKKESNQENPFFNL